jgi:hypothetical protein
MATSSFIPWSFLDNFLISALNGTLSLIKVYLKIKEKHTIMHMETKNYMSETVFTLYNYVGGGQTIPGGFNSGPSNSQRRKILCQIHPIWRCWHKAGTTIYVHNFTH